MDRNQFLDLIEMLPKWATDKTMQDIVMAEGRSLEAHVRQINTVAKNLGLDPVTFNIKDLIGQKQREQDKVDKFMSAVKKEVDGALNIRAVDPLKGFAEVAEISGRMLSGAGDKIGDFSGNFYNRYAKAGKAFGLGAKYAGKGIAGMAAFGGALAPIIMAQEKNLRQMIDYGMMFDQGLDGATDMRGTAAGLGMSIPEMLKSLDGMRHVFVNTDDNLADSAMSFNRFTSNLASASRNDEGFNQFGLIGTEFVKEMGNVTRMFFELGEMDTLNLVTRNKIRDTFTTTQKITLALSDLTGINREQLITNAMEAKERENVQLTLLRNKEMLEEKYGEGVTVQIGLNADLINSTFKEFMPSIADNLDKAISNYVGMLGTTESATMALPQELMEVLTIAGGSDLTNQVINLLQEGLTGREDRQGVLKRVRDIVKTASELTPKPAGVAPEIDGANQFINEATVVPETFTEATNEQIDTRINEVDAKTEQADDAIESVESVKVAMRTLQHKVVPGYKHLGGIFASTTEDFRTLKEIFKQMGIIDDINTTSVSDELKAQEAGNVSPFSDEGQKIIAREGGYGGVFDPQTGVVIADDQMVPDSLATGDKSRLTGPAPSKDPTIEMAPAEVPPIRPGDRVHQIQNKTAAIRKGPLSNALLTILQNAAIVTDPNLRVEVTSGGQMPLEEWEASTEKKSRQGKKYFINGKAVRTGSRRHDGGDAADAQLRLGDHLIPYTHPKFLQFTEAFFALGGKAGSADHDYMGKHRGHFDIVGTSKGGGTRWNASAGFAQAQDSGLIMASRPEANPYLKRLQEIKEATLPPPTETENVTVSNITDNNNVNTTSANNSVTPTDEHNERIAEIEQAIKAEQERISRSESGVNEYFGSETRGRSNSLEAIEELNKKLTEMTTITQQHRTDAIVGAQ